MLSKRQFKGPSSNPLEGPLRFSNIHPNTYFSHINLNHSHFAFENTLGGSVILRMPLFLTFHVKFSGRNAPRTNPTRTCRILAARRPCDLFNYLESLTLSCFDCRTSPEALGHAALQAPACGGRTVRFTVGRYVNDQCGALPSAGIRNENSV